MKLTTQSVDWQPKLLYPGEIVRDVEDIDQCIRIILTTPKGTDPHRPEFALDLFSYIDRPLNLVRTKLIAEISEALELWEPRVTLRSATVEAKELAWLHFTITWSLKNSDSTYTTNVTI